MELEDTLAAFYLTLTAEDILLLAISVLFYESGLTPAAGHGLDQLSSAELPETHTTCCAAWPVVSLQGYIASWAPEWESSDQMVWCSVFASSP